MLRPTCAGACALALVHAASLRRHRYDLQYAHVAPAGQHRRLHFPRPGSAGRTREIAIGCARCIQQRAKAIEGDLAGASRTDRIETTAAELAGTSALSCPQQHDERV